MHDSIEVYDLVIVGAGVYGTCAANTYLSLYPTANIRVLDSDSDVGGTWSASRLYPNFWSQSGVRISGFPDVPFALPEHAPTYYDLFEAKHLAKYLEDYVTNNAFDGQSLRDRFVFSTEVTSIAKDEKEGIWLVKAMYGRDSILYKSRKIIIATGLTSHPNMPDLPGKEEFQGPILHQKDFGRSSILTQDEPDKEKHVHITVLGGGKSAADIAYAAATDLNIPRRVSWIIRRTGMGPLLLAAVKAFGKYRNFTETASTRAIASLSSADPWVPENWWNWFLQKTSLGDWLLGKLWTKTEGDSARLANYDGREGALEGFEGMRTTSRIRWRTGQVGILQSDDFWDVIAKKVQIIRQDVVTLKKHAVELEDGSEVKTDVLICATGWAPGHPYFNAEESARLGLPIKFTNVQLVEKDAAYWSRLEEEAQARLLSRFPYLANAPRFENVHFRKTPYRLYNLIVPPEDQSIVFLGQCPVPNSYHTSVAQALYGIAALQGLLPMPTREVMDQDIAFICRWSAVRYPFHGAMGNVVEFEMVSYTDHLLAQLGLSSHRSLDSWWSDLTDPCLASDYAGLVDEFRSRFKVAQA